MPVYRVIGLSKRRAKPVEKLIEADTPELASQKAGFMVEAVESTDEMPAFERTVSKAGEGLKWAGDQAIRAVEAPANIASHKSGKRHTGMRLGSWLAIIFFPIAWPLLLIHAVSKRKTK